MVLISFFGKANMDNLGYGLNCRCRQKNRVYYIIGKKKHKGISYIDEKIWILPHIHYSVQHFNFRKCLSVKALIWILTAFLSLNTCQ